MADKTFKDIALDIADGVAVITLNRPEAMNAYTVAMMQDIIDALDITDADDSVGAVIFTGAGDRAFCAGADLSAGGDTFNYDSLESPDGVDLRRDTGGRASLRIWNSKKPVIGAINGAAVGIGATIQLPMDFRLASEKARFGFVFSRRGIVPEAASSWFLPRLVGVPTALEWCYTGRLISAEDARAAGLVRSVHKQDELMPAAMELAREIVDNTAPVSVSMIRAMMWRGLTWDNPMRAHEIDSRGVYDRGSHEDAKEGVMSFLEKRAPNYSGKVSTDMPKFYPFWTDPEFSWPEDA